MTVPAGLLLGMAVVAVLVGVGLWGRAVYRRMRVQERRNERLIRLLGRFRGPLDIRGPFARRVQELFSFIAEHGRRFFYTIVNYGAAKAAIRKNDYVVFGALAALLLLAWPAFALLGFLGIVAEVLAWILGVRALYTYIGGRYNTQLYEQLPDTISIIVRALRVGVPLPRILDLVCREASQPTAFEFTRLVQDIAVGLSLPQAFANMAERVDVTEYRFMATVIEVQAETGGTLVDIMAMLEKTLRERRAIRKKAIAASGEVRLTSYVLLALPFLVVLLLEIQSPAYFNGLLAAPRGYGVLALAGGLWCLGLFSIRFITARVLK
ncbi:MAG: type II secretion system F family protein [Acetobacter papayae]|uniref:type II secretion system F family protein n=1 Tax=Acetobacter papayae TaxID=1076592 RepID=UPI0039ED9036